MTALDTWLKQTTRHLSRDSAAQVRAEIQEHYEAGRDAAISGGATTTGTVSRLKRSGMFWTVRGPNAIIALRCSYLNRRFEDYWESRSRAA